MSIWIEYKFVWTFIKGRLSIKAWGEVRRAAQSVQTIVSTRAEVWKAAVHHEKYGCYRTQVFQVYLSRQYWSHQTDRPARKIWTLAFETGRHSTLDSRNLLQGHMLPPRSAITDVNITFILCQSYSFGNVSTARPEKFWLLYWRYKSWKIRVIHGTQLADQTNIVNASPRNLVIFERVGAVQRYRCSIDTYSEIRCTTVNIETIRLASTVNWKEVSYEGFKFEWTARTHVRRFVC